MPTGKGKSHYGGIETFWNDLADDTEGQASKMDACPFISDALC